MNKTTFGTIIDFVNLCTGALYVCKVIMLVRYGASTISGRVEHGTGDDIEKKISSVQKV